MLVRIHRIRAGLSSQSHMELNFTGGSLMA